MSSKQILIEMLLHKNQSRRSKAVDTIGVLRGGNIGLLTPEGKFLLNCPRKAVLRSFFALEESVTPAKSFIFDAGLNSEYQFCKDLEEYLKSLGNGWELLTQKEVGTKWVTANGIPVTGSPDAVIVDRHFKNKPVHLFELKQVVSVYKAISLLNEGAGADAIAQAAHYSYCHGKVPATVVYSSSTVHHNFAQMYGTKHIIESGRFEAVLSRNTKGEVKSLLGFRIAFDLMWGGKNEEEIYVSTSVILPDIEGAKLDPVKTCVSWPQIKAYYEAIADPKGESVFPPPINVDLFGKPKSWSLCNFCEWQNLCTGIAKNVSVSKFAELIRQSK